MAASVDMFGPGGEGLGGLFVGNQMAQQQALNEAQVQQAQASAAHANALAAGTDLSNQYESAILGDKVAAFKQAAADKQLAQKEAQFNKTGESFGKMSVMLQNIPAAARPAALAQMAEQAGVPADHPMLKTLSQVNPEELPATMQKFSQGFYEQSDMARAEKQKRDAMLLQAQEQGRMRSQDVQDRLETQRQIAADRNATLAAIAAMREGGANQRAAAKQGGKGSGLDKMTVDQRISYLENKGAVEGLSDAEQGALENLKQFALNKGVVGKTGTTEDIMGLPSPAERAQGMAKGTPTQTKQSGSQRFQEGKVYQDASGNKARYENGKWVPLGAPAIPK